MGYRLVLSSGMHKRYHRAVQFFEEFHRTASYSQSWPIPIDRVLHFAVHMKQSRLSVGTIKGRWSALTFVNKSLGYKECLSDFRAKRMLDGWHKEEGPRKDPWHPLSPGILKDLFHAWGTVCTSEYERMLFYAASLIAFLECLGLASW